MRSLNRVIGTGLIVGLSACAPAEQSHEQTRHISESESRTETATDAAKRNPSSECRNLAYYAIMKNMDYGLMIHDMDAATPEEAKKIYDYAGLVYGDSMVMQYAEECERHPYDQ